MNENLAKYRRLLNISQSKVANIADLSLTAYRYKESGEKPFSQNEIVRIYIFFKKEIPEITIEDLFFKKEVINTITKIV